MALAKSELHSSPWSRCDELCGGMNATRYKDPVLVLLFIKDVSDNYAGQSFAPIQIPDGASFSDLVAFKGKTDIGDQINKRIIARYFAQEQQAVDVRHAEIESLSGKMAEIEEESVGDDRRQQNSWRAGPDQSNACSGHEGVGQATSV